ncbi:hypothetical protein DUI87_22935 [Hirundo rustica rustica]|uniref:Centriolar satellite-associated tubulin polyglutamylase complex regulator 1 n=1 Tax=Hirundo rustica rustica TaxID=333673 RepID=A0A3M0JGR3_HIRRU|nr:hypothetical protein DUI87_22935 [Hirundo rustica rustica]
MLSPERLSLPGPEYLGHDTTCKGAVGYVFGMEVCGLGTGFVRFPAQRHVLTYMEDAVSQLLENREDISQYGIARFFTEYLKNQQNKMDEETSY